jgi:hypothetical protein
MDEKRKGEIALVLLKYQIRRGEIRLTDVSRKLGNLAKETGIPRDELKEFARIILAEFLKEVLG